MSIYEFDYMGMMFDQLLKDLKRNGARIKKQRGCKRKQRARLKRIFSR